MKRDMVNTKLFYGDSILFVRKQEKNNFVI